MPNQGGTHGQKPDPKSPKGSDGNKKQQSKSTQSSDDNRGGKGNFAEDRERAAEAGRKGGKA